MRQRICCPPSSSVPTRSCRRASSSLPNSATTTPHQGHRGSLYAHRLYLHVHNRYQEDTRRMIVCAPASASCPGANRRSGHAPPARHVIDNFSCTNLPAGPSLLSFKLPNRPITAFIAGCPETAASLCVPSRNMQIKINSILSGVAAVESRDCAP